MDLDIPWYKNDFYKQFLSQVGEGGGVHFTIFKMNRMHFADFKRCCTLLKMAPRAGIPNF